VEWSELGFFIATAKDGYILYSTDGFNWINSVLTGSLYGGCWSKELGIFVIVGDDIIYTSSLKNRKPTNENIFNNEFNSIDEDGTWTFNALNTNSILLNGSSVSTLIGDKQDTIEDGDLTIAFTDGLQSALNNKQDTIEDGDLTIAKTAQLQTALDDKQDTIEDGDLSIANTSGLQTALNDKQDTIEDGDLTIANTDGLLTALDNKQDEITTDIDLTLNSITTNHLTTSGKVGFDTTNIQFNTLVVRRPTGNDKIVLNEIQVWVNDANIMVQPTNNLIGYFADWDTDKDTSLPPIDYQGVIRSVDKVYNNILENNNDFGAHSESGNALIIKDIPLTNINDIHSIVIYNRNDEDRSIGLVLELYNIDNDAELIYPLATSNVITTYSLRYRFDFPSISIYSLGFANGSNTEKIVIDTIALTETISISNIEMTGNVSMNNDLSVGGSLFLGDTNLTEDIDGLLTLDTNKRLIINRLTSASVITGENNCDYLNTTFQEKIWNTR
jgi:hypothetical protein